MAVETEKKYRLTESERDRIAARLTKIGARFKGEDFEENILFGGGLLQFKSAVLRVRKIGRRAILTYKRREPSETAIKRQIEYETEVGDAETIGEILKNLGYRPALVYEKRRRTWILGEAEIVLDELPFGLFMEIEAEPEAISAIEKKLEIENLPAVMETYPLLAERNGERRGDMIEARFK